jgi:hypothetical protein
MREVPSLVTLLILLSPTPDEDDVDSSLTLRRFFGGTHEAYDGAKVVSQL